MLVRNLHLVDSRLRQRAGRLAALSCAALLVVGLAAGNVFAAADPQPGSDQMMKGRLGSGAGSGWDRAGLVQSPTLPLLRYMASQAAKLKLTDEQYSTVRSTYEELQEQLRPLLTQLQQEREALAELWRQPEVDEQAVLAATERVTKLALEVRNKVAAAQEKVEAVLTPEQKKELDALKLQQQERQEAQKQTGIREKARDRKAWRDSEQARKLMELRQQISNQKGAARFPYLNPGMAGFMLMFGPFNMFSFGR